MSPKTITINPITRLESHGKIEIFLGGEGKTLYEKYPGGFEAGGIVNVGSCLSNPHIAGAAIKIASIFAKRKLRANYEEIVDYVLNRVGAVGVAWGAMSQKGYFYCEWFLAAWSACDCRVS